MLNGRKMERMTIDEAMEQEKELAKKNYMQGMLCHANPDDEELDGYIESGKYHEQLAEWLEELKLYQSTLLTPQMIEELKKSEKQAHKTAIQNAMLGEDSYNKALDDFAILMKEALNHDWATTKIYEQIIYNRLFDECDRIAEQLKEQNK